jgi:hypothetical protein
MKWKLDGICNALTPGVRRTWGHFLPYPETWPLFATLIGAKAIDGHKRNFSCFICRPKNT